MSLARELSIKKGACTRLTKELANYSEEARTTAEKVASMRAAGEPPHDVKHAVREGEREEREGELLAGLINRSMVSSKKRRRRPVSCFVFLLLFSDFLSFSQHQIPPKKQENIAAESALMVPDTRQRLAAVAADMRKLLVRGRWFLSEKRQRRFWFLSSFLRFFPFPSKQDNALSRFRYNTKIKHH